MEIFFCLQRNVKSYDWKSLETLLRCDRRHAFDPPGALTSLYSRRLETVLHFRIEHDLDSRRLDRVLSELLPDLSRSAAARHIDEGRVSLDGTVVTKRSANVAAGQRLQIVLPPPAAVEVASEDLPLDILYQDEDIAVINKAPGVVVHPAAGHAAGTLVNALLHHLKDLSGVGGEVRPGIVHRLDKDTSGVMIVAKHDRAHRALTAAWNSDAVEKEYLAIVYGTPKRDDGRIEAPIGRHPTDRKKMAVVSDGRYALTLYRVIERYGFASLVRCRLKTGRTHQIRVHLKHLGFPLVGDRVYSGPQWRGIADKRVQKTLAAFDRQALHAAKLSFAHPRTGERMIFEAPLPSDLQNLLAALRG